MSRLDEMTAYLPPFLTRLKEMAQLLEAEAPEFERQNNDIFDLTDQLFITTATWGLDRWEKILKIPRESGDTEEMRRLRLISKMSNIPPITHQAIEQALNRFLKHPSAYVRMFPGQYRFYADIGLDDLQHMNELIETLEKIKPAHLAYTLRAALNETLEIKDRVILNNRRYRKVSELKVGYSVTLNNNEVVLP
ncbi:YmfQ family protein [Bacillus velezensis]|uniref:YmfQ family protein n=1 Tax=Bacillus velezensis TaxID=492670 RepID=UPI0005CEC319|nr:YmfQ family protein [Bacillus velezensis]KJD56745.1 phage portal protein [Bacillus amyloliquefaciens]KJR69899.1 phage portal protein [Bacillus velezensis]MDR7907576.1 YmfQ family protein [Bacillus velezensis]OQV54172.1 phage portal protein [Bacillus velezensis]WHM03181.1 YmfQ family protein [Bacillus velezensis]